MGHGMSQTSFIRAHNLSTSIPHRSRRRSSIRADPLSVVRGLFSDRSTREFRTLLSDMNFEIKAGDRVGLIGQNGAGKTTLLRLLAGALVPSSGSLEVCGVTQKLLSVSMGMQPDATGVENVYLLGYCTGLSGEFIEQLMPEIVEFADLEAVIEDPVHTYSSGMQLRLAFAVATAVKPEILLMDEWLSTGDRFFVQRSNERLLNHIDSSEILVFASHSASTLTKICTRGLVLKGGRIVLDGDIEDAIGFYESEDYQAS
jgi:ABC-type polysaccharide/polyol phosphate transport system ATPase subunit